MLVRLGGGRADHHHSLDPVPGHCGDDVPDAVAVDGDRLAGERQPKRGQHHIGSVDCPVDRLPVVHVGLHDAELFVPDREIRRSPGHRHNVVAGGERLLGELPAGRPAGSEDNDPHGCSSC